MQGLSYVHRCPQLTHDHHDSGQLDWRGNLTSERASRSRSFPLTELAKEETDTAELLYIKPTLKGIMPLAR